MLWKTWKLTIRPNVSSTVTNSIYLKYKIWKITKKIQIWKSASSCFVQKATLTENVYVSLSGEVDHREGAFKTGISSDREKSFTTPKEVPLADPAFFSPPLRWVLFPLSLLVWCSLHCSFQRVEFFLRPLFPFFLTL